MAIAVTAAAAALAFQVHPGVDERGRALEAEARALRAEAQRLHAESLQLVAQAAERQRLAEAKDAEAAAREHQAALALGQSPGLLQAAHYRRRASYLERKADRLEHEARVHRAAAGSAKGSIQEAGRASQKIRSLPRRAPGDVVGVQGTLALIDKEIREHQRQVRLESEAAARLEANAAKLRQRAARWRAEASLMR